MVHPLMASISQQSSTQLLFRIVLTLNHTVLNSGYLDKCLFIKFHAPAL